MRRLFVALHEKAGSFDKEDVGPNGAMTLLALAETGEVPLNKLATALIRDKSQITRTIRALERKGLVKRRTSAGDARVNMISLTEKGQVVVDAHILVLSETVDELLSALPDESKRELTALLQRAMA
ncbi:MAG: MarR family transcriptional regulator [Pseudomonadota bacterium]